MGFKRLTSKTINEASKMNGMKAIVDKQNECVIIVRQEDYEQTLIEYIKQHSNVQEDDLGLYDDVQQA